MEQVKVCAMTAEHISELARLEKLCFSEPWSEAGLAAELENENAFFRVARDAHGNVLGYVGMHCVAGECYIDNVAVFPDARRKGAASALLNDLVDWARQNSCAFVTLEVRPSNSGAIALYQKFGFEEVGRRKRFYRDPDEDGLILTLNL
ncbi:MAG: ribosomal protein S18-alanine N-acetyltransferase [Oscillospiraceae bacterium]|nr:ribosomal protein S18-alanine N-acetyltransferase [Oscillospiraceae bacterium]